MNLIVGLGNPGRKYTRTRHNVGFRVLDELAGRWRIELSRRRFNGLVGDGRIGDQQVMMLKPLTYMNRSGQSVSEAFNFYKQSLENLLVVYDDMALPTGQLRVRAKGSAGGHKGLSSVIQSLGSDCFPRLRLGIGSSRYGDAVNHVLGGFSQEEEHLMSQAIAWAADAVECWLANGVDETMNRYNRPLEIEGEEDSG